MGFLLLVPFFLIRFGLLARLNRGAVSRAAHFAPMAGGEKTAYWFYQISTAGIIFCILSSRIRSTGWMFPAGAAAYGIGLVLLILSVVCFAAPADGGLCRDGLYRLSRNPMYVAYFMFFLGCVLLTRSPLLLALLAVFQVSAHWVILAEERWCAQAFGEAYLQYKAKVRRYI